MKQFLFAVLLISAVLHYGTKKPETLQDKAIRFHNAGERLHKLMDDFDRDIKATNAEWDRRYHDGVFDGN